MAPADGDIVDYLASLDPAKAQELLRAAALLRAKDTGDAKDTEDSSAHGYPVSGKTAEVAKIDEPKVSESEAEAKAAILAVVAGASDKPERVEPVTEVIEEITCEVCGEPDIWSLEASLKNALENDSNQATTEAASLDLQRCLELGNPDGAAQAFGRARLDHVFESGWTSLHWAVHVTITAQNAGDDCGQVGMCECCTPQKAHPAMRKLLKAMLSTSKASRFINVRAEGGATPLMFAADAGDAEVCDWLLAAGADISLTDDDGDSAARWALLKAHTELAERLSSS